MFFLAGLCFASWASRIVTVQQTLHLSDAALGAVLFSLPVGLMLSLPFSGWIITIIGSRRLLIASLIAYGVALIGLSLAQNVVLGQRQASTCRYFDAWRLECMSVQNAT